MWVDLLLPPLPHRDSLGDLFGTTPSSRLVCVKQVKYGIRARGMQLV
jgi:hypothetical protein